jgi:beta-N-acetylhexosaminidase
MIPGIADIPERAAGRMTVAGLRGLEPDPEILEALAGGDLGGVILFSRNYESPEQIASLVTRLQEAAPWPLLIAVDQEGGADQRFRAPFSALPPMARVGSRNEVDLAYRVGRLLGAELAAVGVNWNLAPVLDVDTNPANPIIGQRAFGSDPFLVARLGVALARGLEESGVLSCGKHFPGHGDTSEDSHLTRPVLLHDLERLRRVELVPFAAYAQAGFAALMTAHVLFAALDEIHPATLSAKVLPLLRQEIGFEGLVVSDGLEMRAVADRYSIEEMVELGVEAGVDTFLFCHDLEKARRASARLRQLATGPARPKLATSLQRLEALCRRFELPRRPQPAQRIRAILGSEAHRLVVRECEQ